MMFTIKFTAFIILFSGLSAFSQISKDTLIMTAQDSSIIYSMELREIVVSPNGVSSLDEEEMKAKLILKRRIFRVYPYAKLTADKLNQMDATMAKLKTNREKNKYFKIVEKYLSEEFEPKLKKLSRKDGQILVKLINRQTGVSTYNLIKEYKSGWKAFWANSAARLFSINLKAAYDPHAVKEDYYIEGILNAAFDLNQLPRQDAAKPIEFSKLNLFWAKKSKPHSTALDK